MPDESPWNDLPAEQQAFLDSLANCGNVSRAASLSHVGRSTVYHWRQVSSEFAEGMEAAERIAAWDLEEQARQLAMDGEAPSERLLMFLLKGLVPEKYDRGVLKDVESGADVPRTTVVVHRDPPKEPES